MVLMVNAPAGPVLGLLELPPFPFRPFPVRKFQETKGVRPIRIAEASKMEVSQGGGMEKTGENPLWVTDNRDGKIPVDGGKWMG
jgi:hypothetical protein